MHRSTFGSTSTPMQPHEILGIPQDVSEERVRAAYKALALKWHPDRQPVSERDEATARFVEINKANRTMLRNLRRARRATATSSSNNAENSSPESTSTTLPDYSSDESATCSSSSCSGTSEQSSSSSSASSCSSPPMSFASCSVAEGESQGRSSSHRSSPQSDVPFSEDRVPNPTSSTSATTPKSSRSRIRKQSKSPDPITGNTTPKTLHRQKGSTVTQANFGPECMVETLHPVRSILRGAGADVPKRWVHVLNMTLEELYFGKKYYFRVVRYRQSGKKTVVPLELSVTPGTSAGTEIVVDDAGNERKDGTIQAIVFIVKELKHEKFTRLQEDLLMEVRLPWVNSLEEETGEVYFHGVDGKEYGFTVDYHKDRLLSGTAVIPDAGMPSSSGGVRGRVVIRWGISSPHSSWDTLKQILRFKG